MLSKRFKHLYQRVKENPGNLPSLFKRRITGTFSKKFSRIMRYHSPPPEAVMLYLTERCNLNCEVCFLKHIKLEHNELEVDNWIKLIDEISKWKPRVSISGGEPLLYNGIDKILDYLRKKRLSTTMTTNGTLIDKHLLPVTNNVERLKISIDGPEEIHDTLRGIKGTYNRVMHNITLLNRVKSERYKQTPFLTMYTIITTDLLPYLEQMIEIAIENGFQQIRFLHLLFLTKKDFLAAEETFPDKLYYWKGAVFNPEHLIDGGKIAEAITKIKGKRYPIIVEFEPDFNFNEIKKYYERDASFFLTYRGKCKMPWTSMTIKQDGRVEICPDYIIGDVGENSLTQIWNSGKAITLRRFVSHNNIFPVCKSCCALFD